MVVRVVPQLEPVNGAFPRAHALQASGSIGGVGLEDSLDLPNVHQLLFVEPNPDVQPGQEHCPERAGVRDLAPFHRKSREVGQRLTDEIVPRDAAVDLDDLEGVVGFFEGAHVEKCDSVGQTFEKRSDEMFLSCGRFDPDETGSGSVVTDWRLEER